MWWQTWIHSLSKTGPDYVIHIDHTEVKTYQDSFSLQNTL